MMMVGRSGFFYRPAVPHAARQISDHKHSLGRLSRTRHVLVLVKLAEFSFDQILLEGNRYNNKKSKYPDNELE